MMQSDCPEASINSSCYAHIEDKNIFMLLLVSLLSYILYIFISPLRQHTVYAIGNKHIQTKVLKFKKEGKTVGLPT